MSPMATSISANNRCSCTTKATTSQHLLCTRVTISGVTTQILVTLPLGMLIHNFATFQLRRNFVVKFDKMYQFINAMYHWSIWATFVVHHNILTIMNKAYTNNLSRIDERLPSRPVKTARIFKFSSGCTYKCNDYSFAKWLSILANSEKEMLLACIHNCIFDPIKSQSV